MFDSSSQKSGSHAPVVVAEPKRKKGVECVAPSAIAANFTIDFHGTPLEVYVLNDGREFLQVRSGCGALGINFTAQYRKLLDQEGDWASVAYLATRDSAGRTQQTLVIEVTSLRAWLFKIEPRRVKRSLRAQLTEYRRQVPELIAAGLRARGGALQRAPSHSSEAIALPGPPGTMALIRANLDTMALMFKGIEEMEQRTTALEQNTVKKVELEAVRQEVRGVKAGMSRREFKAHQQSVAAAFDLCLVRYCQERAPGDKYVPYYREACVKLNTLTRAKRKNWRFDHFYRAAQHLQTVWGADTAPFWETWKMLPPTFVSGQMQLIEEQR